METKSNPFEDLMQEISEVKTLLKKFIQQTSEEQSQKSSNNLLNFESACKFLQVAPSTLYKYVSERKITFCKSGKHLRFWEKDLIEFNNKGRHNAIK